MSLAERTTRKYAHLMSKLSNWDLSDIESVMTFLDAQSVFMRRDYLLAIVNHNPDCKFYRKILRDFCLAETLSRVKRQMTEGERDNFMTWAEVIAIRECRKELKDRSDGDHMIYVLLCLYTMLPPQRGQVYYNCWIDKDVKGANLLDLDGRRLVVRAYKTMKTYGDIVIELPDELVKVLIEWKPKCLADGRLLSTSTGRAVSESSFTHLMYTIFGQKVSTNMIRKIYVTNALKNEEISIDDRREMARLMGHSISTQEFMYNKK